MAAAEFTSTRNISGRQIGRAILGTLLVAAEVGAEMKRQDIRRQDMLDAQNREDSMWNQRKFEALANIERGLTADHSRFYVSMSIKRSTADRLRMEVEQYCRERREIMMASAERQIASFVQRGTV